MTNVIKFSKYILDTYYRDWRATSPLPPDLLTLCVSYNCEIEYIVDHVYKIQVGKYDGKNNGVKQWLIGDKVVAEEHWVDGKRHGMEEQRFGNNWDNGERHGGEMSQCHYINGKKHEEKEWNMNTQLVYICRWIHGMKHVEEEECNNNGQRIWIRRWVNGEKHGYEEDWVDGQFVHSYQWINGKMQNGNNTSLMK